MTDFLIQPKTMLDWSALIALFASLGVLWLSTKFPTKAEFSALQSTMNGIKTSFDDKADNVENRVASLENAAKHLPTREDIHELRLTMERQSADRREQFAMLGEKVAATQDGMRRIEELLLQKGAALEAAAIDNRPPPRRRTPT